MIRRSCFFLLAIAAIMSFGTLTSPAETVMTHHVREATRTGEAQLIGRMAPDKVMTLNLVLALRDPDGLKAFLADIYNPASPNFRHFLTPAEFTEKFGPTQADYDAVVAFATRNGLYAVQDFPVTG